jgi:hypothetical protein
VEDGRTKVEELYDLEVDLGEQSNLAKNFPEKVVELKALMKSIEGKTSRTPSSTPNEEPGK